MINRKKQIVLSIIVVAIGLAIIGFDVHTQNRINSQTITAKKVLKEQQNKLKTISSSVLEQQKEADPTAQKNDRYNRSIKLIENNANAFFKQLYSISPKMSQDELNISNRNLKNYATNKAIAQTGMLHKTVSNIKKYDEQITYDSTKINVDTPNTQGICSGIANVNSLQTSINFKGQHNQNDWFLFKYNNKTHKFIEFTALGFNFSHE